MLLLHRCFSFSLVLGSISIIFARPKFHKSSTSNFTIYDSPSLLSKNTSDASMILLKGLQSNATFNNDTLLNDSPTTELSPSTTNEVLETNWMPVLWIILPIVIIFLLGLLLVGIGIYCFNAKLKPKQSLKTEESRTFKPKNGTTEKPQKSGSRVSVKSKTETKKSEIVEESTVAQKTSQDQLKEPENFIHELRDVLQGEPPEKLPNLTPKSQVKNAEPNNEELEADAHRIMLRKEYEPYLFASVLWLSKKFTFFLQPCGKIAEAYPPSQRVTAVEIDLLLVSLKKMFKSILKLEREASELLKQCGVQFDADHNATTIPEEARQFILKPDTPEYVKAYLFMAEYGQHFDVNLFPIESCSLPLLFAISMSPRYPNNLRKRAASQLRTNGPMVQWLFLPEERALCHYPVNALEAAILKDKKRFMDLKSIKFEEDPGKTSSVQQMEEEKDDLEDTQEPKGGKTENEKIDRKPTKK